MPRREPTQRIKVKAAPIQNQGVICTCAQRERRNLGSMRCKTHFVRTTANDLPIRV